MRWPALVALLGCGPQPGTPAWSAPAAPPPPDEAPIDLRTAGIVVDRLTDFAFDGGRIELEMRRDGNRIIEVAYNRYAVPVVMAWQLADLVNLEPTDNTGVAVLPAAPKPNAQGAGVVLTTLAVIDPAQAYRRMFQLHARFGDPQARPVPYAYRLPYAAGKTFAVLQGFHGAFSHRGSNEFAVDFDCPVATKVLAARPGVVVASNAAAQGAGTSPDYLEYARTNFVLVLHDDGTLGEYMHLAPSGVEVAPGDHVARGQEIALSGNTGFSSTPHLHFQVMTAADDGVAAQSFPIRFSVAPHRVEEPVQGRAYPGWE
ncbi:MAG TPA: M23 family metallopeptidase [Kofleriaceae bacterium]|nr:M23 family metallopeptidase [Kofleriaceae bacterium]